jgi:glucose/arabinose dehydrogenase
VATRQPTAAPFNPAPDPSKCFNRVSRFTAPATGPISPASEKPIIPYIPVGIPNHNGGDLASGKDGLLYVNVGDGGVDASDGA